jgi:hypothetical protein
MAIVSYRQDELRELTAEESAVIEAHRHLPPTEEDLAEIPEMTEAELASMIPWSQRKTAMAKETSAVGVG